MKYFDQPLYEIQINGPDGKLYGWTIVAESFESAQEMMRAAGVDGEVLGTHGIAIRGIEEATADEVADILNAKIQALQEVKH